MFYVDWELDLGYLEQLENRDFMSKNLIVSGCR